MTKPTNAREALEIAIRCCEHERDNELYVDPLNVQGRLCNRLIDTFRALAASLEQPEPEQKSRWVRCSPGLLLDYPDGCAKFPRRPGDDTYSHDHWVSDGTGYLRSAHDDDTTPPPLGKAQPEPSAVVVAMTLLEVADKMAEGVRRAVQSGVLDSRSMAADAELIYTPRRKVVASALPASESMAQPQVPEGWEIWVEFGYKAAERGVNLIAAIEDARSRMDTITRMLAAAPSPTNEEGDSK